MKCVKTPIKQIATTLSALKKEQCIDMSAPIFKTKIYAFIPVKKNPVGKYSLVNKDIPRKEIKSFRAEVERILTQEEKKELITAYDTIGSIAILEIPDILKKKEKKIAELLLQSNKGIKTVVKKASIHQGVLRIQNYQYIAGEKTYVTRHKENNVTLILDIDSVYYSPRSASERKRVAQQIKPGEEILVMFSGCAPFVCVIGKNTKAKKILGIELNDEGHKYGLLNLKENKLKNVDLVHADVRVACKELSLQKKKYDRIIMPLPKSAQDFLEDAFSVSKKGTIIHFYSFSHEKDFPQQTIGIIDAACKKAKKKYRVLNSVLCGNYSPRVHRVCVDFMVL